MRTRRFPVLLVTGFLTAMGACFAQRASQEPDKERAPRQESLEKKDSPKPGAERGPFPDSLPLQVPTRDGKSLAADMYLPSKSGRFPTILIFTPYDKKVLGSALPGAAKASDLFGRGDYAFVVADWRGFYGSKDAAVKSRKSAFKQVGEDGYDLVEWIATQEWSNGKVGMWGPSALGMAQYRTAAEKPPHLVCIVPIVIPFGLAYEHYYHGGVYKKSHTEVREDVGFTGSSTGVTSHPVLDAYWKIVEMTTWADLQKLDVPILLIGGWYDVETDLLIETFKRLRLTAGPTARAHSRLLIGPWEHVNAGAGPRKVGEMEFLEAARVSEREALQFFDHWLRDKKDGGWENRPIIRYFQMGSNRWESAEDWPTAGMVEKTFFLKGGALGAKPDDGDIAPDTFKYNPNDPSPTLGGMIVHASWIGPTRDILPGPKDQRAKVEQRQGDHATYTSEPLEEDVAARGVARVRLFASSDRVDTDFMVRLCDVHPDGRSMLISDGAQRMRFRNSLSREEWMEPSKVYEATVTLAVTAHTFVKGHRIRIIVSSSNYPRFDVNPNNGDHFLTDKRKALVATNAVYHDAARPSALILPVVGEEKKGRGLDAGKGAYDKPGPYSVKTLEFPDLKDAKRKDRRVPIKVLYPDGEGPFPLVIMSHGAAGTWDANLYQAQHLASHGYVVFCLEHLCSNNKRVAYYMSLAGGRMTFREAVHRITKDADAMLGRPKDVSFAIDQAIAWNGSSPALKGRIDTKKIGMMGHSYGAYTTLVVCGARPIRDHLIPAQNPPTGLADDLSDPRVTFGFPMSPQPTGGTYFGEDSYKTINRPLVCLTGPKDNWKTSDGKVMPGERRLEFFKLVPPGEKYFFWLEGADHMSFSDGPKAVGPFRSAARPDAQRISKALMAVSCDYYLKGKKEAAEFLSEAYVNSLCGKVVTKGKLMTK